MSTLKELGGMEAAKKRFDWLDGVNTNDWPVGQAKIEDVVDFGKALIERVEELARELDTFVPQLQDANRVYGIQLQAACELAKIALCQIGRRASFTARESQDIREQAREFLKMLEDK